MQIDDAFTACPLVQAIDVLRDQLPDVTQAFQSRQRFMRRVRRGVGDHRPAKQAARPVTFAHRLVAGELLMRDRWLSLPVAAGIAIARNARGRADARAGQDEHARMLTNEGGEEL